MREREESATGQVLCEVLAETGAYSQEARLDVGCFVLLQAREGEVG